VPGAQYEQDAARSVGGDLADHFADEQIGEDALTSPAADDYQIGVAFLRFRDDFPIRLRPAPYPDVELDAGSARLASQLEDSGERLLFRTGHGPGRDRLVFDVAHHRQHAAERNPDSPGEPQRDPFGARVVLGVLGRQQ
jgi:hypothetical protein